MIATFAATETSNETQEQYATSTGRYRSGHLIFDIETGPLSETTIRSRSKPFQPPPHPGEFDREAVKVGNLKDKAKIAEKIESARRAHNTLVENYTAECERLEQEYWANIIDRAALSPLLGRVVAIGIGLTDSRMGEDQNHYLCINEDSDYAESWLLEQWWQHWYWPCVDAGYNLIGHNIHEFDVPFLIRRSWLLGLDVPEGIKHGVIQGRYLNHCFVDTSNIWRCGSRSADYIKLDDLGRALGVGGKVTEVDGEEVSGKDFARLYFGTSEERGRALDYLAGDVDLTRNVARRLGLV